MAWYTDRHDEAGGWLVHSTLTVPHRAGEDLAVVLRRLVDAWSGLRDLAGLRSWRARLADEDGRSASPVVVLQVKWSPGSGWHPHFHVLWFCAGDRALAPEFGAAVGRAWAQRVESVTGRPVSASSAMSELVKDRDGVVRYYKPDDPKHPKNDCGHPAHPGCPACPPPPVPVPTPGGMPVPGRMPRPLTMSGREVFSQVGVAAVAGDAQCQAVLAEYVQATVGYRRVHTTFAQMTKRFGAPPEPVRPDRLEFGPEDRVWVDPDLVWALETATRRAGGLLQRGLAAGDPQAAADFWGDVLDRPVSIVRTRSDGAPLVALSAPPQRHRRTSGRGRHVLRNNNQHRTTTGGFIMSNETPQSVGERKLTGLRKIVAMFDDKDKLGAALTKAVGDGRDAATRASKDRVVSWQELIIASGDSALLDQWSNALLEHVGDDSPRGDLAWDWFSAASAALEVASGSATPPPPSTSDAPQSPNGAVPVTAGAAR